MRLDTIKNTLVILEEVVLKPMKLLFISDTASMTGLTKMFENDYAELFQFIGANQLHSDKIMAFYLKYENPLTVDVAVAVDRLPAQLMGRVRSKIIDGGNALVAHYTGSYEKMDAPYTEISNWVKDNNRQARGLPFEVYLKNPTSIKNRSELRTDIYQMLD